jgi:hypothetical protein
MRTSRSGPECPLLFTRDSHALLHRCSRPGGDSNGFSSATQTISLASLSTGINTGHAQFGLSGWLGGYESQNDQEVLTATFRDGSTLSADISLDMTRNAGSYNDGYADNLSFSVAAPVPEPETYAMLLTGMLVLGASAARRKRK